MRLTKRRVTPLPDLNLTPLIDVVFQLLIFFMLVPQMSQVNKELLELPKLKGTEDQQRTAVTINIDSNGDLLVAGHQLTIAGVVELVSREIQRVDGDVNRLTLLVRADRRGNSRMANQVVAALARLGVRQIRVGVEAPP